MPSLRQMSTTENECSVRASSVGGRDSNVEVTAADRDLNELIQKPPIMLLRNSSLLCAENKVGLMEKEPL